MPPQDPNSNQPPVNVGGPPSGMPPAPDTMPAGQPVVVPQPGMPGTNPMPPTAQPGAAPQAASWAPGAATTPPATPGWAPSPAGTPQPNFQQPMGVGAPQMGGSSPLKKFIKPGIALVVVIALAVGGWFAYNTFFASIKLKTYSTSDYSVLVPASYTQKTDSADGGIEFIEKGKTSDNGSQVVVFYQAFPSEISSDEISTLESTFKDELKTSASSALGTSGEVKDLTFKDTTFQGQKAMEITGTDTSNGATTGKVKLEAVFTTKQFYVIGVEYRIGDHALQKSTDKIINSFKLK